MEARDNQPDYSALHGDLYFEKDARTKKAAKYLAVGKHALGKKNINPNDCRAVDVGCSTGFQSALFADDFRSVVGIDIDRPAIKFAKRAHEAENLYFAIGDCQNLPLPDQCADLVICTHIYEHVPSAEMLMHEIERILAPSGVCVFGAGNRLCLIEPHHRLPFLSVLPVGLAHIYVRMFGRAKHYHERLRYLPGLKKLVSSFELTDYTKQIVLEPKKFEALDMLPSDGLGHLILRLMLNPLYFLIPTYIWVLKKRDTDGRG